MSWSDNSLKARFVGFPVWLGCIGFPHPPSDRWSGLNPFSNENEWNPWIVSSWAEWNGVEILRQWDSVTYGAALRVRLHFVSLKMTRCRKIAVGGISTRRMKRIWFHFLRSGRFHYKTKVLWFHCAAGTISLYVKFVGFPVWLSGVGFPHPPRTSAPSPKGRLTDTEAISSSLLLLLARSATHAEGVTLFCSLSTVHEKRYLTGGRKRPPLRCTNFYLIKIYGMMG